MTGTEQEPKRRRSGMRVVLYCACGVALIAGALIALCYLTPLSYLYCLSREQSWMAAKTEAELDSRMWAFYTKRTIATTNSMWGNEYKMNPGDRMVQYLIFRKEPLDVVFDSQSRVVVVFTSYE